MKALALYQPYCGFIAAGLKTIETRWWDTKYRGVVLFCATKSPSPNFDADIKFAEHVGLFYMDDDIEKLVKPVGVMLCVGTIVDSFLCHVDHEPYALAPVEFQMGDGSIKQKYGFAVNDVRLVKQKPVKCGRKWFTVPDEDIEYVVS